MIDVSAKYDDTKFVTSKFDRRFAVSPLQARTQAVVWQGADDRLSEDCSKTDVVEPETHAGKDGLQPTPQSVAEKNEAVPPEVEVPDVRGGAGRPAGELSPEKYPAPDLRDRLMSSVANYVLDINQNWQRGVDAFMNVGRLCAEANARLTTADQQTDGVHRRVVWRKHALDFGRMQAGVGLDSCELAERRLPEQQAGQHREKFVVAPSPKEAASDSAVVGLPIAPIQGAVLPCMSDDSQDNQQERAAAPDDIQAPKAVTPASEVAGPLTPPPGDDDIPVFLDRRPLSANDQRAFDGIIAAFNRASAIVRERIRAELARPDAWSGSGTKAVSSRRRDDDASATPNPPTASVALAYAAYAANAAERAEVKKPEPAGEVPLGVKPEAADPAGAGIKHTDLQVPDYTTDRMRTVVVVRKRRKSKKVPGSLENLPF
jgi:hypothetical protein